MRPGDLSEGRYSENETDIFKEKKKNSVSSQKVSISTWDTELVVSLSCEERVPN